jgi:hypothetical protein
MTFKVLVPVVVTDIMLQQSTLAEDDYAAWSSATAYVVGDRVISTTSHKIYECVLNHTNQSPLIAANIGVEWVIVGPTNRWKPFDQTLASTAVRTTGDIAYRLWLDTNVDTVAIFGMAGGTVTVLLVNTDTSRRNLLQYSEELNDSYWTRSRSNIGVNIALDPFDTFQAESMVEDATAANTHGLTSGNVTYASGTNYTFSSYVKRGVGSRNISLRLPVAAFPGTPSANFDLGAGTAGTATDCTSGIEAAANGWYRIWINATADASVTDFGARFFMLSGTSDTYNGDNSSSIYTTGVQLNTGPLEDYQWIRDVLTFGYRVWSETRTIGDGISSASSDAIFTGIPGDAGDYLAVSINKAGSANTQVSEIVFGQSYEIGTRIIEPTSGGIIDFSVKERDDFGNVTLVRRNFAERASYTFYFDKDQRQRIRNFLAFLRAVPLVFYSGTDLTNEKGMAILGFITSFDLPVTVGPVVIGTLEAEGLA